MPDDIVLRADHVSKKFCRILKHVMLYGAKDIASNMVGLSSHSERLRNGEFWAVDDVSFELRRGETLGLIGPNGSGKSTMLKMINGIFMPDKGQIEIKGRVGALIEVGAGFHPMLTGRENIYINGAILGMNKKEIDKKFDEIIDFAGIGEFIDAPVKHYSSGMYVRLGFAVAAHCEPDILLVDEVLAVGDSDFQTKCMNLIEDIKEKGTTIILVSHNEILIERNTRKALLLNKGTPVFIGDTQEALMTYSNLYRDEKKEVELFVDEKLVLHIDITNNPAFINKVFVGFAYRKGVKTCTLVKRIEEADIVNDKIKVRFDVSHLENCQYFFAYRIRDKVKHNKILTLSQNNYFEIKDNYTNENISSHESCGIVIEGIKNG